jgi:membrane protease YdiL (CAAX protease family)
MHPLYRRILTVFWPAIVALVITAYGQGIWGLLVVSNLGTSPKIPWAVGVMVILLWLMWQYLGGRWWPRSTSDLRRSLLRANPVPRRVLGWAVLSGALSIIALSGCWIVLFQLVRMPPNVLPDMSEYPYLTVALMLVMASLAAPLSEEAAFRGYFQVPLERQFSAPAAVVISSILFALAHGTHGFFWPKLLVYFLVGLSFGATAYLTNSILPGIAVHILGDVTFFALVWPYDAARRLVTDGGTDAWFWIHAVQAVLFTLLAISAFRGLARAAGRGRSRMVSAHDTCVKIEPTPPIDVGQDSILPSR